MRFYSVHRIPQRQTETKLENSLILRTRIHVKKNGFLFQSRQNSRLTFVGEQNARVSMEIIYPQKENFMNSTGRTTLVFLTGLGIGAGLAVLFAPRSGEETREWIADTAERKFKMLRRVGRRSFRQLQDAVAEGEEKVTGILRNGKKALESVAAKLD
jgi:gas vesicle protein